MANGLAKSSGGRRGRSLVEPRRTLRREQSYEYSPTSPDFLALVGVSFLLFLSIVRLRICTQSVLFPRLFHFLRLD